MSVPLTAFMLCIRGGVKQLVVCVCCLSDQSKNWDIYRVNDNKIEIERQTYRCVSDSGESGYSLPFLIRSQIEYDRGQLYVEWTHIHCSIYADISMLSVTPSGLIYECCTLALSMGTEPIGL